MKLNRKTLRRMILKEIRMLNENSYNDAEDKDKAAAVLGYFNDYLNQKKDKFAQLDFKPALLAIQKARDENISIEKACEDLTGKNKRACELIPTYFDGSHKTINLEEDFEHYKKKGMNLKIG